MPDAFKEIVYDQDQDIKALAERDYPEYTIVKREKLGKESMRAILKYKLPDHMLSLSSLAERFGLSVHKVKLPLKEAGLMDENNEPTQAAYDLEAVMRMETQNSKYKNGKGRFFVWDINHIERFYKEPTELDIMTRFKHDHDFDGKVVWWIEKACDVLGHRPLSPEEEDWCGDGYVGFGWTGNHPNRINLMSDLAGTFERLKEELIRKESDFAETFSQAWERIRVWKMPKGTKAMAVTAEEADENDRRAKEVMIERARAAKRRQEAMKQAEEELVSRLPPPSGALVVAPTLDIARDYVKRRRLKNVETWQEYVGRLPKDKPVVTSIIWDAQKPTLILDSKEYKKLCKANAKDKGQGLPTKVELLFSETRIKGVRDRTFSKMRPTPWVYLEHP